MMKMIVMRAIFRMDSRALNWMLVLKRRKESAGRTRKRRGRAHPELHRPLLIWKAPLQIQSLYQGLWSQMR
jgi:hypothetical protein